VLLISETGRKRLPHVVSHLAERGNAPVALALVNRVEPLGKPSLFCQSQHRALPSLRKRALHPEIEVNTDDALALSGLGFALVVSNVDHNYEVGMDMVDRAIRSNPNYAAAYNSRGFMKAWNGGSDTAIADFEHSKGCLARAR
jgi:hypothetical protein